MTDHDFQPHDRDLPRCPYCSGVRVVGSEALHEQCGPLRTPYSHPIPQNTADSTHGARDRSDTMLDIIETRTDRHPCGCWKGVTHCHQCAPDEVRPPAPRAHQSLAEFLRSLEPGRDTYIAPTLAILL